MGRGSTGAIIALVFFFLTSVLTGWLYYSQYNKVDRSPEAGGVKGLRYQLRDAEDARKEKEKDLAKHQDELAVKMTELRKQLHRAREEDIHVQCEVIGQMHAGQSKEIAEGWQSKVKPSNELTLRVSKEAVDAYTSRKDDAGKRNDQRIKDITKEIGETTAEIEEFKKKLDAEKKKLDKERTGLRNLQSDYERKVEELVTREPPAGLPPVGRVLTSDPEHNLAVISLGTRHGAKPGMRFEVFQTRRGNTRVHKGFLEVKTSHPEVSSCAILVKEVRLPRCPVCSYTSPEPRAKYCPRCTRPGTQQGAQRLSDSPKVVIRGKLSTDPIVKGDLLFNPFFSPKKKKRYAVTGQPLIRRHKDYSVAAIKKAVQFHGNQVDERLSARTDVLIALRGGEDVKRAKELGIVIVYGWELFEYLER
jgi:hypothetical protein